MATLLHAAFAECWQHMLEPGPPRTPAHACCSRLLCSERDELERTCMALSHDKAAMSVALGQVTGRGACQWQSHAGDAIACSAIPGAGHDCTGSWHAFAGGVAVHDKMSVYSWLRAHPCACCHCSPTRSSSVLWSGGRRWECSQRGRQGLPPQQHQPQQPRSNPRAAVQTPPAVHSSCQLQPSCLC